jgi:hypothetical protein
MGKTIVVVAAHGDAQALYSDHTVCALAVEAFVVIRVIG